MMKRIVSLIMVLLMTVCPFASAEESVTDKLFIEFENYLHFEDALSKYQLQAVEAVEKFLETKAYDDLVKARITVQSCMIEIGLITVPETVLTDEEYFMYEDMGADMEALDNFMSEMSADQTDKYRMLANMYDFLTFDVFYAPQFENYKKKLSYEREIIMRDMLDTVYFANDFLVVLGREDEAAAFWKYMKAAMPALSLQVAAFVNDEETLWALAEENQKRIDACIIELEVLDGSDQYFYDRLTIASESLDFSEFSENRTEIHGMPDLTVEEPFWIDPVKSMIRYFYTDAETGAYTLYRVNSDMEIKPTLIAIINEEVAFDDLVNYADLLYRDGWSDQYEFSEDGTIYCSFVKDGSKIQISWTEQECTVYILSPLAELVPFYY